MNECEPERLQQFPAIRIVGCVCRNAAFPNRKLVDDRKNFGNLAELVVKHASLITVHDCVTEDDVRAALLGPSLVTIVICHGWRTGADSIRLSWGNRNIEDLPSIGVRSAVIFNACFVLHEGAPPAGPIASAVEGRALVGGLDIVQRSHVKWFIDELIREIDIDKETGVPGKLARIGDPNTACATLGTICDNLRERRDRCVTPENRVKKWDKIWSAPTIV